MNEELLKELSVFFHVPIEELRVHEAVLSGLREEGLLTGTRRFWTCNPTRALADEEVRALVYAAAVAAGLDEADLEIAWEEPSA